MNHHFSMQGPTLAKLIGHCGFAVSTEETRYYLNGIYLHLASGPDGPMLRLVATDGHRLAQVQVIAPPGTEGMPSVIVPRFFLPEMQRIAEAAGEVEISLSVNKIRVGSRNGTVLVSKLVDGAFPDYQRVIPRGNDKIAVIERSILEGALDRVLTIAATKSSAVKMSLDAGRMEITHSNPDAGSAVEEIDIAYDGEQIEVGFNGRYLLDMLNAAGGDRIVMQLGEPGTPGLFHPEDDENALYVCMPMRV